MGKEELDIQIEEETELKLIEEDVDNYSAGFVRKGQKMALYVLTDDKENIIHAYFNQYGIYPYTVTSDMEEANKSFLIDPGYCILLVIDSGTGKFTGTVARKQLVELIGAKSTRDKKFVLMFYTDTAMKAEADRMYGKKAESLEWIVYKGTYDILKYLKNSKFKIDNSGVGFKIDRDSVDKLELNYVGDDPDQFDFSVSDVIYRNFVKWSKRKGLTEEFERVFMVKREEGIVGKILNKNKNKVREVEDDDMVSLSLLGYEALEPYFDIRI